MAKKVQRNNFRLFRKYFFSYLLIFFLPFSIISASFYFISTNNLREAIIESNIAKLEQVRDFTDERMGELRKLAGRISLDHRLTPYRLNQPYTSKEGIEELVTYETSNSIIDTIVLTFFDDPTLYTTRGTTTVENLISNVFPIPEEDHVFFTDGLAKITEPTLRTFQLRSSRGNQDRKALVYVCPIPPQSRYYNGAVVFFIRRDKLGQLIANTLGDFEGSAYIYNQAKGVIASSDGTGARIREILAHLPPQYSGVSQVDLNGEEHSLVTVHSTANDLSFVAVMPTGQFYKKMSGLKMTIMLLLGFTVIVGMLVTIRQAVRHYRPIERLIQSVRNHWEGTGGADSKQNKDLDGIRETIEVVFENSRELRKKVLEQRSYVRDQFLLRLLKSNISAHQDPNDIAAELQMTRKGSFFFVLIVSFNERISEKSLGKREKMLGMLQEVTYGDCVAYGTELFDKNAVALIVNMGDDSEAMRRDFAQRLAAGLANHLVVTPTIGVGKIYSSINMINRSYIEASAAVDYYLTSDDNYLIFFENVTEVGDIPDWYSFENQVQLTQSIKQGDQDVALEALHHIVRDLKEQRSPLHWLKYMCFDLINTVLKVNSELGMLVEVNAIEDLTEFKTLEELEQKLGRLIKAICAQVEQIEEDNTAQLYHDVVEYIENRFTQHDLSLTKIADIFELSASYLSKLIKEYTGSTFTQYVWDLRVAAFKEKLLQTDEPIKNLVCEIGYVDVANFTRKFRKSEGITPGQYRKQHSNGE